MFPFQWVTFLQCDLCGMRFWVLESHNLSVKEVFTGRAEESTMDTWRSLRACGLPVMGQVSPLVLRSRDITLLTKGPYRQSYGFSSSHLWMWELDYKESWAPKNWCFWTVMLKTLQCPSACQETQSVHPKGNQSRIFIGRTNAEAETPIVWPPDGKNWLIWKPWCWERLKAGRKGDGRAWNGWIASPGLNGHVLSRFLELEMDREAWHAAVYRVTKCQTWMSDWTKLNSEMFSPWKESYDKPR